MYSSKTGLILGFHGCDQRVLDDIILGRKHLHKSHNSYDWLGNGFYLWENSPSRAYEWAVYLMNHPPKSADKQPIENPAVLGADLDLGYCLDLTAFENLTILRDGYNILTETLVKADLLPRNVAIENSIDLLKRELDCAVIETIHEVNLSFDPPKKFDSVRGVFWEGEELYPIAGFKEKNHIQICVRNPNCIKGFFKPMDLDSGWQKV